MKHPSYDVISLGDATLDMFVKLQDASVLCSLDRNNCWLCLNYAEKIPIHQIDSMIGGNACNNAVGSSRLGLKAGFYTIIGDDDTGRRISAGLKKEKVSLEYVKMQKKSASNYSVVLNYKTERTILVYHQPRNYHLPKLATTKWVYLTSLGKEFIGIHEALLRQMKSNACKLMFNPGTHQLRAGQKKLAPVLKSTSVLILNKEEAHSLLGIANGLVIKDLLTSLHRLGPEAVVVTDGEKGAYGYDGRQYLRAKPLPSKVLERTGAGDSFSTGILAALSYNLSFADALLWGSANAASVIEHTGPQAGLLTKRQLLDRICDYKGYCKVM